MKIVRIKIRKCRVCGCTNYHACAGGCYWVEPDLCSKCADKITLALQKVTHYDEREKGKG